jgi:tetratricopeptide (TPR) repeat protein
MQLDDEDRLLQPAKPDNRPFLSAVLVLVTAAVVSALLFATIPEFRDEVKGLAEEAKRLAFVAAESAGVRPPEEPYAAAYARLRIARLSAALLASSKISSNLARLSQEPCDKKAIFAFGEALAEAGEGRMAAQAYLGFGGSCPNGEGDRYRAAQILFNLGDNEQTIAILEPLISANPTLGHLHYLRGKALASWNACAPACGAPRAAGGASRLTSRNVALLLSPLRRVRGPMRGTPPVPKPAVHRGWRQRPQSCRRRPESEAGA